jgi:hypothetical protein
MAVQMNDDWLPWCASMGMYVTRDELRSRILSGTRTVIVDVRDDDHKGVSQARRLLLHNLPLLQVVLC